MTKSKKIDEWNTVLSMLREKSSLYLDEKLCEIIEFLRQAKTNEMLSATTQIALADPNPVRRLDGIENRLDRIKQDITFLSRRINELEQK